jgi:hypothetical protein
MADIKTILWSEVGTTAMKRSKIFGFIFVIYFAICVGLWANDYMLGLILGGFWPIPLALALWGKKVAYELDPSFEEEEKKKKEEEKKKKIEEIKNKPLPKSIQRDLEQLRKDQEALSKKLAKLPKL